MGPQYTESVDGKQRKGFYLVSNSDEPCLEMVIICTYLQYWSENFLLRIWLGRGEGERERERERDQNM